jgi:hypothetical protein
MHSFESTRAAVVQVRERQHNTAVVHKTTTRHPQDNHTTPTRQDKTRKPQDNHKTIARQDKTRQDTTRQDKARQDNTTQHNATPLFKTRQQTTPDTIDHSATEQTEHTTRQLQLYKGRTTVQYKIPYRTTQCNKNTSSGTKKVSARG